MTCWVRSEGGPSYCRTLSSLATIAIAIDEWSVITDCWHAADGILIGAAENSDGTVKGGAAYTNWRWWAPPKPNDIRISVATVGTTSFLAVISRGCREAFIACMHPQCSLHVRHSRLQCIFGEGRSMDYRCYWQRKLVLQGTWVSWEEEGCIFRERLARSLERDLDKHH